MHGTNVAIKQLKIRQRKDQENKRITLKIYNQGLELIDEDNRHLLGEISNYFIPRAEEEIIKVTYFHNFILNILVF